ncbi:glycosyltransferase family 71 protein [Zasmidium cellare ATCC 36951]|uniref:Glycosyltransferase family 71 protein n=1 Tax=Zasmidium cellare ATCC 36951 TaxID=1080233 RepID=A0A6A6CMR2_ZASCE|nr:glycosyltransferase family 71 protein [Zasmidium cellare ATCC 36951]KAF2168434.1 glycosyltransferase family 71 protein [Zasmidium cellare ATCC 36951]
MQSGIPAKLPKPTYRVVTVAALVILALSAFSYHRSDFRRPNDEQYMAKSGSEIRIIQDAHKFENADDFLPHFKNITSLKPMLMRQAKSTCTWSKDDDVDFNFGESSGWFLDLTWVLKDMKDKDLSPWRSQWQHAVNAKLVPWSEAAGNFEGRGIVIVGGNGKSLKRVKVLLRQLKRLGTRLPVEIHYFDYEMSSESQEELKEIWPSIFFNDLSGSHNIKETRFNPMFGVHFQLKTAAMVNSRFAEPLLLDSDNIPVIDPDELYESATYKEYGTIFWPDISRTRTNNPIWPITNTRCRMDEFEQESGQLLINKRKFFYHLQLAAWFMDSPENEGRFQSWMLGDKDCYRFAWHALKTKYGRPSRWVTSVGTNNSNGFYCGHTFAQHHPDDGRVAFLHGGLLKTIPKPVMKMQLEEHGGVFQAYKRSPYDHEFAELTTTEIGFDNFDYMDNKPEGTLPASCTHFSKVEPRPLDEIVPGFQETFKEIGGYWMLDENEEE